MKLILDILKGVIIGVANIIPGVSGGTMAVSMGIYDTLISSITNLFKDFKQSIKNLIPLAIGVAIGIVGLAFFIEYLFANYPLQTRCTFIGLILGGVPAIINKLKGKPIRIPNMMSFIFFFMVIIILQLLGDAGSEVVFTKSLYLVVKLFIIGVVASATMVIPGVSGSMILMLLGYYNPIIETINQFIRAVFDFNLPQIFDACFILIPFGIGVLIGIFAIAKAIEILLTKAETFTYSGILGLVIASPIVILMGAEFGAMTVSVVISSIIALAAGVFVAYKLGE